jgi:hypothetical protein
MPDIFLRAVDVHVSRLGHLYQPYLHYPWGWWRDGRVYARSCDGMTSAARFFQTRRETAYCQPRKAEGRLDNLEISLTVKQ